MPDDKELMRKAIELALLAEQEGNLPVGALITLKSEVIAEGQSAVFVPEFDATRHAEMEAIRAVPKNLLKFSSEMSLYTTLEPCLMCFSAIHLHGIGRVVFGAGDDYGGPGPVLGHLPEFFRERQSAAAWVGPILPEECNPLRERLRKIEDGG